jgi:trigger factor
MKPLIQSPRISAGSFLARIPSGQSTERNGFAQIRQGHRDEVKRKLISDSYRKAVDENKLDVLGYPDIEEIQFSRGQPLQFAATMETAPEFELPEYKGIPVKREARTVTEDDVTRALDALRQQQVSFTTVQRPIQSGDFAVVNYSGTSDGKPIIELAPAAQGLNERKNFWVEVPSTAFIPGSPSN